MLYNVSLQNNGDIISGYPVEAQTKVHYPNPSEEELQGVCQTLEQIAFINSIALAHEILAVV
jgi:hypothetical protein